MRSSSLFKRAISFSRGQCVCEWGTLRDSNRLRVGHRKFTTFHGTPGKVTLSFTERSGLNLAGAKCARTRPVLQRKTIWKRGERKRLRDTRRCGGDLPNVSLASVRNMARDDLAKVELRSLMLRSIFLIQRFA